MKKALTIHDNNELANLVLRMNSLRLHMRETKLLIDEGKEAVMDYMKRSFATSVSTETVHVSISEYERKEFDMDSFKTEHPTLYKKYLHTVPSVRLSYRVK